MSASEKVAWTEVCVVAAACTAVALLTPWLGDAAMGAFGLLGFLPVGMIFLRPKNDEVLVDERDRQIERRALSLGVNAAWMGTFLVLIAITIWFGYSKRDVPVRMLVWLVWLQFAVCYVVKGITVITAYRRQRHAA